MARPSPAQLDLLSFTARRPAPKAAEVSSRRGRTPPSRTFRPDDARQLLATGLPPHAAAAQDRAVNFCRRFTEATEDPDLAFAACLPRVRRIFWLAGQPGADDGA